MMKNKKGKYDRPLAVWLGAQAHSRGACLSGSGNVGDSCQNGPVNAYLQCDIGSNNMGFDCSTGTSAP